MTIWITKKLCFFLGHFGHPSPRVPKAPSKASHLSMDHHIKFRPDRFGIAGVIHKKTILGHHNIYNNTSQEMLQAHTVTDRGSLPRFTYYKHQGCSRIVPHKKAARISLTRQTSQGWHNHRPSTRNLYWCTPWGMLTTVYISDWLQ